MPEEIGPTTPKLYDTSQQDGRFAPIRTNPDEDALQLHTDGEISGENLKTNLRRSPRDGKKTEQIRYHTIYWKFLGLEEK